MLFIFVVWDQLLGHRPWVTLACVPEAQRGHGMQEEQQTRDGGEPGMAALCCKAEQISYFGVRTSIKAQGWVACG